MAKPNNSKTKWIWLSVLILLVCVAVTTIVFLSRLDVFLLDDEGAISLITEDASQADDITNALKETRGSSTAAIQRPAIESATSNISETTETSTAPSGTVTQPAQPSKNPGFEASDDNTVWSTNTQVEIFSVSYVNGEQVVTVNSGNGDKVIAPGTENSYTFKLKNIGNVALDYTVTVDASFTPADIEIPIIGRLNRYDGTWIIGGKDEYAKVSELDTAEDSATLGAGKYTYYTLDWSWPFESDNDELDTMLGNLGADQDVTFTIVIKTTAAESSDPYDDGGITTPETGDDTHIALFFILAVSSLVMIVFLLIFRNKEKLRERAEANTN